MVTLFSIQGIDGAHLGLHAHGPVHQLGKLLRNREAQPRAAVRARRRRVHLLPLRPNSATLGGKAHLFSRRRVHLFCHGGRIQPFYECSPPIPVTGEFSPPLSNFAHLCPSANSVHLFPSRANSAIFRVLVFRRLVPGSGVMGVGFRVLGFVLNLRTTTSQKCAAVPRRARI